MSGFAVNFSCLTGNLTKDPELRSLPSGAEVCQLRIAFNERFKDSNSGEWQDKPGYIDVSVWSGVGRWAAQNLGKGDTVTVAGPLRFREWQTQGGEKRSALSINAESIVPRDSGGGGGGRGAGGSQSGDVPVAADDFAPAAADFSPRGDGDDDIPF